MSPNYPTQEIFSNNIAENNENFSKPGVLGEEDFSLSSDCLQISHTTLEHSPIQASRPQAMSSPHGAEGHVDESVSVTNDDLNLSSSTTTVQNSTSRTLQNGIPEGDNNSYPNQPVEDFYESDIRVHIGQVSENPSIQNLSGQLPSMVRRTTIGLSHKGDTESLVQSVSQDQPSQHTQDISQCIQGSYTSEQAIPAAGVKPYAVTAQATVQKSELNASGQISIPQSEERKNTRGMLYQFKSNAYLIAAAAIGMATIFVALKHK